MNIKERFFSYIKIATTSDEESGLHPSAKWEFDLANKLADELKEIGLDEVELDDKCYIYAHLKATPGYEGRKSIGFISHMDTAPDFNGENVNPQVHENYDGKAIKLGDTDRVLSPDEFSDLLTLKGKTLITTDGTSLLGADDKAGVAEIMTLVEDIITKNIPHCDLWVCFTPDEEIGEGALNFSRDKFKADYAYTVDGDYEGEVAYENFNAGSAEFEVYGKNVHPGEAKNIMINAASIGCEIQNMIPSHCTPEHTEGREGFIHLTDISGTTEYAKLSYIVRDHDADKFTEKNDFLKSIESFMNNKYGEGVVKLKLKDSYRNMYEVVAKDMTPVDVAKKAIEECDLECVSTPIRGGTDGAHISFMGLPCPNLGTGGHAFHGPYEHIALESMEKVVEVLHKIVSIYSEEI
ncbi:MAG: peptidase T [Lachnospiraceae bacterium]|nr:peptidase T [Lachnospiraceae bacterium]